LFSLAAGEDTGRKVISQYLGPHFSILYKIRESKDPLLNHRASPHLAVVDGRFKYIVSEDNQRELYNLVDDPGELHNIIKSQPDEAKRLADYLSDWLKKVPAYQPPKDESGMSPEILKILRSLGYIGDDEK